MSNNHLTATPIVNKLGVATTVHRRAAPATTSKRMPPPRVTAAHTKPATPLTPPEPLSDAIAKSYSEYLRQSVMSTRKRLNREETELLHRIIKEKSLTEEALAMLTGHMGMFSPGERIKHYDYDSLLLAERLGKEIGSTPLKDHSHVFAAAVQGLCYARKASDRKRLEKITTQEELDGHVAVLRYVMENCLNEYGNAKEPKEFDLASGKTISAFVIESHGLAAVLREQPHRYDKIAAYVEDRGAPRNKAAVAALREYLENDEDNAALSDGWL